MIDDDTKNSKVNTVAGTTDCLDFSIVGMAPRVVQKEAGAVPHLPSCYASAPPIVAQKGRRRRSR